MTTVRLSSVKALERIVRDLGRRMEAAILAASWTAARWGEAEAVRSTMRAKISASHTFARAWISRRVKDGAIVGNSAAHAYFVERGRRPGKGPPIAPIEEWIKLKKVMPVKPPRESRQASQKYAYGRGVTGDVLAGQSRGKGGKYAAAQRVRLQKIAKQRERFHRSDTARGYRHRMAIRAMAMNISRKIARRGTKARFILGKMLQPLGRRFHRDIKRELAKISLNPPR